MRLPILSMVLAASLGLTVPAAAGPDPAASPERSPLNKVPWLPPLKLTDAQRDQVRQALAGEKTEVTFQLKSTKSKKDFEPSVGAQIPNGIELNAFPWPLVEKIPPLKQYTYVKLKHQVLIVNGMTRRIVDQFPGA
jgi:hypothetical protein